MFTYKIEIPGKPIAKKTHRDGTKVLSFDSRIGRYCYRSVKYNPLSKEVEQVKKQMLMQYPFELLDEPLKIEYLFQFQITKSWSKKQKQEALDGRLQHWQKPDVSNLVKFYEDCMIGTIFVDDCIIVSSPPLKCWAEESKTTIWIRPFTVRELRQRLQELLDG
ncbi:MAG: RusA family crossover junction endodeoxyribonuclease [Minisyncoccia bacterium]